ncbi:MAG: carbohydrate ABC transporter permease [Clostridia bacterium]|nr:carbohydrate ABC transporter permease [Clostridia bacterium]
MNTQPTIKKETKNKIRVEFDRTPLKERLKAKFLNLPFYTNIVWYVFRFIILLGVSYIVLYPFFTKIAASFMSPDDFIDVTVRLIPKYPSFDQYKAIFLENKYMAAFFNTLTLSLISAILQTFVACLVGYGLAKFKFKGNSLVMGAVILTMVVPHGTVYLSMFMKFRYFDIFDFFGIFKGLGYAGLYDGIVDIGKWIGSLFSGVPYTNVTNSIQLTQTFWPMILLSITGLAFKNGLYIFMMRQFFRGVPDELEESAYIDGSDTFRTFLQIIIPLSVPMMITIFLFSFSWQWTDEFYTNMFISTNKIVLMPKIVGIPKSLETTYAGQELYYSAINNTCGLMIILPLVVLYLFCQRYLVQGIERSGIVG